MSVQLDKAKLEAKGFSVELTSEGAMIAPPGGYDAQLVKMDGDTLILAPSRSSFHRQISAALGILTWRPS